MIEAGFRTRTTRSETEMAKYAVKVGDTIKHFGKSADGTTKNILARVTAIHPKETPGFKGTWNKEGWREADVNVIDRFKDGAAAIEFEVIEPSTSVPISEELEGLTEAREVYESLFIATGKPPITFTVGVSTWKLNKNFNYDLIDQDTGEAQLKNANMVTGIIEEDVVEYTILTKEQLNDYIKDFEQKVIAYNLDELLAIFGINIKDVYKNAIIFKSIKDFTVKQKMN